MKQLLIVITCFVLVFSNINTTKAQTILNKGDIAFIGLYMDGLSTSGDGFTFILLRNLDANTIIYFTDEGWDASNTTWYGNTNDAHISWTVPTGGLTIGTIVYVVNTTATNFSASSGTVSNTLSGTWNLASSGDQMLAYQSTTGVRPASPTFIAAVDADYYIGSTYDGLDGWGSSYYNQPYCSYIPAGLNNGVNCVALVNANTAVAGGYAVGFECDNYKYTGTLTGTASVIRTAINTNTNWTGNEDGSTSILASSYSTPNITANVPTISGISPSYGPTSGGTSVTITGTYFIDATAVKFGATNAVSYTVNSATQITATSPASSMGTFHITVTNDGGTSTASSADQFTYLTPGTFTGSASNDWGTAGNWAGGSVPTAGTDVTIPDGKTAEIAPGTSANCNNITIDPAGSLTIKSDATNTGSLIVSGTATGNVTYQSYLAETGKWHVVTAPVAGQNVWGFATLAGNSIAEKTGKRAVTEYIEATNTWDTNYPTADTEGSFAAGSGYSVLRSDAGVVSYTGTINTSDVSKPITRGLYGWNALGNPYTSAINATETAHATNNLITANASKLDPVFAALYVWDAASGQYVTINNSGTGSLVQNYIQAGQGFFVRAKDNSGLNFSITEAMQTHQPATPLKSAENTWPTILLTAKSNNKLSSTMVTFNSQMTNGLDVTYDAGMFKADKNFALYSKLVDDNGNDFAIQALPEKFEGLIIPLGIDAPAGTEISFSAGIFNLPGEATVYLEDRASNRFTKLDATEAVYTVTITDQTKGAGNFYLHTSAATTGIENQKNGIQVYTRDRAIFVNGNLDAKDVVAVYGIDGKLHYKNIAGQNGLLRIDAAGLPAGIYLVSISQKAGRVTNKIILGE